MEYFLERLDSFLKSITEKFLGSFFTIEINFSKCISEIMSLELTLYIFLIKNSSFRYFLSKEFMLIELTSNPSPRSSYIFLYSEIKIS